MKKSLIPTVSVVLLLFPGVLVGGDGARPIWEPTTITEPGKYIVTRNITSTTGSVITVAANDVTIDLNGFSIETTADALAPTITGDGIEALTVSGGTVIGGGDQADVIRIQGTSRNVVIEDLRIHVRVVLGYSVAAIRIDDGSNFVVRRNLISGGDESIVVTGTHGVLADNSIDPSFRGIELTGDAISVVRNSISDAGGSAIILHGPSHACLISDNAIARHSSTGIRVGEAYATTISRNRIYYGLKGLEVSGEGNQIIGNTINGHVGTYGLKVYGSRNLIEGNVVTDSSYDGIILSSASSENVYRGNISRGNNPDFTDEGNGNTSHGDNYMPNQM